MKARPTALVAALIACGAVHGAAQAQSMPEFKFSGFGTLSAVHSNDKNSDFTGGRYQFTGAGHTRSTSLDPDSKLGGQVDAVFSDKLSGVVQVVTQHQYDNSYTPMVEWANLKVQLLPELSLRVGRIAAPTYLLSESRFVGYSYPWVRPPTEVYFVAPITSNDGVDATWRSTVAGANNTVQAYYGNSSVKFNGGGAKSKPAWGVNDTVDIGSLALRVGYNSLKIDLDVPSVQPLLDAATQYGFADIANKYKFKGIPTTALAFGANYDPGNYFVMAEVIDYKAAGFLADARAWYVSAGYRFGSLTPYLTHSSTNAPIETETGFAGPFKGLNDVFTSTAESFNGTQHSTSIGLRWDAMKNLALKAQFDHLTTGSHSDGRLQGYPGFVQGSSVNVVTVAADFVF
jgi:hypothetical protein